MEDRELLMNTCGKGASFFFCFCLQEWGGLIFEVMFRGLEDWDCASGPCSGKWLFWKIPAPISGI